jgi:hypothetical protein
MRQWARIAAIAVGIAAVVSLGGVYGASYYYTSERGQGCASCHEMATYVTAVHGSHHRTGTCMECHEASLGTKLRHITVHLTRSWPETIRLRQADVEAMTPKCQQCHQHEYASWHAGPHSASYAQIFADPGHNSKRRLMDDCLRCHGMYFNGPIRELVQPMNAQGPWHIVKAGVSDEPAMPCQACHWIHRESAPESKPAKRISVAGAVVDDSLGFYDRRESMHFSSAVLTIPQLYEGARAVHMNQDPRQAICYQCHAPRQPEADSEAARKVWGAQAASGDDRTPLGVHEGLSCISCHDGHNENARASCKTCHPQMSHCGLDVEKMDTTFLSATSGHNIHWAKCADCHQHGIPKPKTASQPHPQETAAVGRNGQ